MISSTQSTDTGCPYVFLRGRNRGQKCGKGITVQGYCSKQHAAYGNFKPEERCNTFEEAMNKVMDKKANNKEDVKLSIRDNNTNKSDLQNNTSSELPTSASQGNVVVAEKPQELVSSKVVTQLPPVPTVDMVSKFKLKYKHSDDNKDILKPENIKGFFNGSISNIDIDLDKYDDKIVANLSIKHKDKLHVNKDKLKDINLMKVYN
jgi:hypothetical protein